MNEPLLDEPERWDATLKLCSAIFDLQTLVLESSAYLSSDSQKVIKAIISDLLVIGERSDLIINNESSQKWIQNVE